MNDLVLCRGLDAGLLAARFRQHGRLQIRNVLSNSDALRLHQDIAADLPWRRTLLSGGKNVCLNLKVFQTLDAEWRANLDKALRMEAATKFNFLFDSYPVSDEVEAGRRQGRLFEAAYDALNAPAFLRFVRHLTGEPRAAYCDAQVTRFLPGHFLKQHDDGMEGKDRLFAYVLNLTPVWKADWGGLLLFVDQAGNVSEGYTPTMNALNIFRVPEAHCVSEVASYAAAPRFSITGWIRARRD